MTLSFYIYLQLDLNIYTLSKATSSWPICRLYPKNCFPMEVIFDHGDHKSYFFKTIYPFLSYPQFLCSYKKCHKVTFIVPFKNSK